LSLQFEPPQQAFRDIFPLKLTRAERGEEFMMRPKISDSQPQVGRRTTLQRGSINTPGNCRYLRGARPQRGRALLFVASSVDLPATFRLLIDASGAGRMCTTLERSGDRIEVYLKHSEGLMSLGSSTSICRGVINLEGRPAIPCLVRDLKAKSARIIVDCTPPPSFWLVIDGTGHNVYCQVVARTQEGVEVVFD
jgi:hypothetical protein